MFERTITHLQRKNKHQARGWRTRCERLSGQKRHAGRSGPVSDRTLSLDFLTEQQVKENASTRIAAAAQRIPPSGHFRCCSVATASPAMVLLLPGTIVVPVAPGVSGFWARGPDAAVQPATTQKTKPQQRTERVAIFDNPTFSDPYRWGWSAAVSWLQRPRQRSCCCPAQPSYPSPRGRLDSWRPNFQWWCAYHWSSHWPAYDRWAGLFGPRHRSS